MIWLLYQNKHWASTSGLITSEHPPFASKHFAWSNKIQSIWNFLSTKVLVYLATYSYCLLPLSVLVGHFPLYTALKKLLRRVVLLIYLLRNFFVTSQISLHFQKEFIVRVNGNNLINFGLVFKLTSNLGPLLLVTWTTNMGRSEYYNILWFWFQNLVEEIECLDHNRLWLLVHNLWTRSGWSLKLLGSEFCYFLSETIFLNGSKKEVDWCFQV